MANDKSIIILMSALMCVLIACEKPRSRLLDKEFSGPHAQYRETQIDRPNQGVQDLEPALGNWSENPLPMQPPLMGSGIPYGGMGGGPIPPIPTDDEFPTPLDAFGSSFAFPLVPPARCGDGIQQIGEECDFGTCTTPTQTEPCNRNGDLNTGCNLYCQRPFCGNFITEEGEECDDGNHLNGDGCAYDCTYERCGNNKINFITPDLREQCDDGNKIPGDGCSPCCLFEMCGNGIIDPGEECDLGEKNGKDSSNCTKLCKLINCPAGLVCTTSAGTQTCS